MTRNKRMSLIKKLQQKRKSTVVVFITGDRPGLETKIAGDVFPKFHKHLINIDKPGKIDLFLYSTGGLTNSGYALVNLFREFCDEFNVIIPFKALSCATLISLGANEIIMTKMGQLSPIDPSISHPLSPSVQLPGQPMKFPPVNVEDVNAFIELAKGDFNLCGEEALTKAFEILATKVNPLVLGAVQRSRAQITFLAKTLLGYHTKDKEQIENIVELMIRQRFSHDYIINRREAKEVLGLKIVEPDETLTKLIIDLFNVYNDMLEMDKQFNREVILGEDKEAQVVLNRAIIESVDLTHVFRTMIEIKKIQIKKPDMLIPQLVYQERKLQDEWIEDTNL